jgi:hypothetical protein
MQAMCFAMHILHECGVRSRVSNILKDDDPPHVENTRSQVAIWERICIVAYSITEPGRVQFEMYVLESGCSKIPDGNGMVWAVRLP